MHVSRDTSLRAGGRLFAGCPDRSAGWRCLPSPVPGSAAEPAAPPRLGYASVCQGPDWGHGPRPGRRRKEWQELLEGRRPPPRRVRPYRNGLLVGGVYRRFRARTSQDLSDFRCLLHRILGVRHDAESPTTKQPCVEWAGTCSRPAAPERQKRRSRCHHSADPEPPGLRRGVDTGTRRGK